MRARRRAALYDVCVEAHDVPELQCEEQHVADDGGPDTLSAAPGRVASIVGAAERASLELREQAEARARERIAEADRAAENRVQAAEEESQEILHASRSQAESTRNEALSAVTEIHAEAERV